MHDRADRPPDHTRPAWPGLQPGAGLVLPLPSARWLQPWPPRLQVEDRALMRRPEAHLTLLDRECVARLLARLGEAALRRGFEAHGWRVDPLQEYWLLRGEDGMRVRFSLVQQVEAPDFPVFRAALARAAELELPSAPPHVTLYTSDGGRGIGVPSHAAFERLRRCRVPDPARGAVSRSVPGPG